ncbi:hypothetical protein F751_0766 [Auxenochlorella protothecoides]|uniref:Uncharacterized protein n=1 Tax=Auxenochlorella protothecoides TaxID=3075 RepID=A0A087SM80_AUXPR|nr:hypothetical protein F751_0766 [Auxenochlorella protothecoides]KFM26834.1 hypothetical protein F751_0766 [Auxenochlorella protothecoides]
MPSLRTPSPLLHPTSHLLGGGEEHLQVGLQHLGVLHAQLRPDPLAQGVQLPVAFPALPGQLAQDLLGVLLEARHLGLDVGRVRQAPGVQQVVAPQLVGGLRPRQQRGVVLELCQRVVHGCLRGCWLDARRGSWPANRVAGTHCHPTPCGSPRPPQWESTGPRIPAIAKSWLPRFLPHASTHHAQLQDVQHSTLLAAGLVHVHCQPLLLELQLGHGAVDHHGARHLRGWRDIALITCCRGPKGWSSTTRPSSTPKA